MKQSTNLTTPFPTIPPTSLSSNIRRTEWELDRHQEEEQLTYEQVMANDNLRDAFQPIVHQYR